MNSTLPGRRPPRRVGLGLWLCAAFWCAVLARAADPVPLPGTQPLSMPGDIASNLVAGAHRFLDRELAESVAHRAAFWRREMSSAAAYEKSVATNRARLGHILGVRDPRPATPEFEFVSASSGGEMLARGGRYAVYRVRWRAFADVQGEGLWLRPHPPMDPRMAQRYGLAPGPTNLAAGVVAIPDADQTPEQIAGLAAGVPSELQFARRLAESGCSVLVPTLIDRRRGLPKVVGSDRGKSLSHREFLYRPAFELGRHLIGYEVQKVLAGVDWLVRQPPAAPPGTAPPRPRIGVIGWGEGGMLALYAGALDPRIDAVGVSGYFAPREAVWQEPIERNVFGLLEQFGDAELAGLVAPRTLIIEAARGPEVVVPPGTGGGPGRLTTPALDDVQAEFERATRLHEGMSPQPRLELVVSGDGTGPYWGDAALGRFLDALAGAKLAGAAPGPGPEVGGDPSESDRRHARQVRELDRHSQQLLTESPYVRAAFMQRLDPSSPEKYRESSAAYRETFARDVIGRFDRPLRPANPRSRRAYDQPQWTGYEVVLDVFPDLFAYGILLLPKDLAAGKRRPVVVCQHGLEGRPQDVVQGDHAAYHDFAAKLAERGFIVFAPQNLYLFEDRFRSLQRKANPLGKTLFSLIVPQHQQLTEWLKTLPMVDPARIGFYGLSYGGKTAMRVPALVTNYCLSICSADFNEWVWKNASTRSPYSYVWTGEYEIFEFDLGSTFNYAEMAALIAPRPFMVERGHFDGVAPDEAVGHEFAKVRHLYAARLGLGDRCEIEWFVGPHTINGQGTFAFLHRHLNWPPP